jgi:hypothetical protein
MLVDLTIDTAVVEQMKNVCKELNIGERCLSSHPDNHIETGVYRCGCDFNFGLNEFIETNNLTYEDNYEAMVKEWHISANGKLKFPVDMLEQYGVADNIEQIKEYYKEWIEKSDWFIAVTPVYQEKENAGKGGGWRWHKWGEYIGTLDPECEYLDDEDFGDDWQGYVLCYHIYPVKK